MMKLETTNKHKTSVPVDGKISIVLRFLQNQSSVINREQHLLHLINFSVLSEIVQEQ